MTSLRGPPPSLQACLPLIADSPLSTQRQRGTGDTCPRPPLLQGPQTASQVSFLHSVCALSSAGRPDAGPACSHLQLRPRVLPALLTTCSAISRCRAHLSCASLKPHETCCGFSSALLPTFSEFPLHFVIEKEIMVGT